MTATNYAELGSNKKAILLDLIEIQTVYYSLRNDPQIANDTYEQVLQSLENHFADKSQRSFEALFLWLSCSKIR